MTPPPGANSSSTTSKDLAVPSLYPATRQAAVSDRYPNGLVVVDPYRWLEAADSKDVADWTHAQNAHTKSVVEKIPSRQATFELTRTLLAAGTVGIPTLTTNGRGRRYFHERREGTQEQPSLYVRDSIDGADRVLLDVSKLSSDGTAALDWWFPSQDGVLLAYGTSAGGSEESVLHIRDVAKGTDLPDTIDRARHASVAWLPDRTAFYYSRYPKAGSVPPGDEKYGSKIFFHKLGTDPDKDQVVFGEGRDKTDVPIVHISPDGKWLFVKVHMGWDRNEAFLLDRSKKGAAFVPVSVGKRALYHETAFRGDTLYLMTNEDTPRYKLVAVPCARAAEKGLWKDVIPEGQDTLEDVVWLRGKWVASYLHDASTHLVEFASDGKRLGDIALPGIGRAGITSSIDGQEGFTTFTSYTVPSEVHAIAKNNQLSLWDRAKSGADFPKLEDIETTQLETKSKDGTRVIMFVVGKKGLPKDGSVPTILYGYGGFNVVQQPAFSARVLATVLHGGRAVTAILRGGGEFGEAWHRAGMLEKKQNVFDDFFAAAEHLIHEKYTSQKHLAAWGGSNGGLLVATAVTQRPELFAAGASLVPLTDMLRYHQFRIAKLWIPEYGSSDNPEQFKALFAYSPYHHVKDGTKYPAMMFTTGENDSRVDPMHARKMAARMQAAQADPSKPILLRVDTKAGHGAGKPVSKLADELADELSFIWKHTGLVE